MYTLFSIFITRNLGSIQSMSLTRFVFPTTCSEPEVMTVET